jgi:hypothetical protein
MGSLAWVAMLVKRCTVKMRQTVTVSGKVCRHPVEYYADMSLVTLIDKIHKIFRNSVTTGEAEGGSYLISPGFVKRMFHNRQKFNMSKAKIFNIRNEQIGKLAKGQESIGGVRITPPGTGMNLVD